ncbi:MAG TPA: thiamine pyrophosphate-dependent enzyme [Chitinophagales bacterium]|jgi:2-oxoisovalerate dehydrogenase E1 component|nr:transketolase [Chitinophagales bacterium]HQV77523.1 thiamine pyrophosphate-dependent enzyme [Chitinophagales bacterium]HQW79652.1 thiamine pyrophosphate-dependent enzyme [Chitinophagales bacterium]HRB69042.1 thiamine pyrophosphate-dependent enzyme [Chitinophagales bacterium]
MTLIASSALITKGVSQEVSFDEFKIEVLNDYKLASVSRETSLIGRKEVLTGKAKFGIFGDGKELPQIALAKVFENGDFRAGYYRDQTFALATGIVSVEQLFGQLYANPSLEEDPHSGGRQMNNHFATRNLHPDGTWKDLKHQKNSAADNSPTASQMIRALGLAMASKKYRELAQQIGENGFSQNGNEICFATIGDASTSEGLFWEVVNAGGVLQVPLIISVWDDGYGISVPKKYQTTKESISQVLKGFQRTEHSNGYDIYVVKGWNYPQLVATYKMAADKTRRTHIPAIVHVEELTQPQGHSTSGSHERYKSAERLQWEKDFDCITKFRKWIIQNKMATHDELVEIENEAKRFVAEQKKISWNKFHDPILEELQEAKDLIKSIAETSVYKDQLVEIEKSLKHAIDPMRKDIFKSVSEVLVLVKNEKNNAIESLKKWRSIQTQINEERYSSYQHTNSIYSPSRLPIIPAQFEEPVSYVSGFKVLNACFDANFSRDKKIVAFGEDVGKIGDVNQAFAGLQEKYGVERIYDTGIREASIMGEGIGLAMRGLRPIAEIQYLDYLLYGLQPLSDDVACLSYRTKGGQKAPLIVRTRGHRLEGIWHTGSPMQMILGSLRGIHVCVPRNMTQAAGFYNLLLRGDEPALVVECLNGYRLKEKMPSNVGNFTVPLGMPEILQEGNDLTLVTYGSCVRIAQEALVNLTKVGISVELIDVQTLLPFDIYGIIGNSVRKTNRILFLDEDFPGGATAYMLQQVVEHQQIFRYLDSEPKTLTAKEHRGAFGSDGDYFCKPNAEDVFNAINNMMHEVNPKKFPLVW